MVCFDEFFTDIFLDLTLPSLLAEGNLPYFAKHYPTTIEILTDKNGKEKLDAHPLTDVLKRSVKVDYVLIDTNISVHKYASLSFWQNITIRKVQHSGESLGFLIPDGVWSNNCFVQIVDALSSGKKAFFWAPLRAAHDSLTPIFKDGYRLPDGSIDISGRDLATLGLQNLNGITKATIWGEKHSVGHSGQLLWPIDEHQYIFRSFYFTPIVISSRAKISEIPAFDSPNLNNAGFHSTFGDMYPIICVDNLEDVATPTDSDEFMHFEVSKNMDAKGPQKKIRDFVLWTEKQAADIHVDLFDIVFKLHSRDWTCDLKTYPGSHEIIQAVRKSRITSTLGLLFNDRQAFLNRAAYYRVREKYLPSKGRRRNLLDRLILEHIAPRIQRES